MKHLKYKLCISKLWLVALPLFIYLHLTKYMCFVFLILSFHECAHILVAWLMGYEFEKIVIYPFGLSASIRNIGHGKLIKEIVIIVAGPLSQLVFVVLFPHWASIGLISDGFAKYLKMINANIMVFNLLPIYPLDGGRLLQSFFHSFLTYQKAQKWTLTTSMAILLGIVVSSLLKGWSALVIELFLAVQLIMTWLQLPYDRLAFYCYRYVHASNELPLLHHQSDLYRGRYNIIEKNGHWIDEKAWLRRMFGSFKP